MENKAKHQSTWSNTATATTPESSPPNEPGGLVAEAYGHNAIKLCWNAQAEEPEDDPVAQYLIEHATSEDGPWMELTRVTAETDGEIHTIHTDDMDLTASTERFYRVTAINMQGPSDQSDVASAMTSERMNTEPTAGAAIADQTVRVDATVMVQSTITDADTDDTLTWSAMSNMPTYATAEVDTMGMVTITGLAEGMATITVTATDIADAMATQEIMVTVAAANTPPMAVGTIDPVTVTAGEMSDAMDVSAYFSDANTDDTLTYTAMSDMMSYATVSVSGSMLTITGVAEGMATVTVTATDTAGDYAMQTIMVTVEAADVTLGDAMTLMAAQGDDPGDVTLTWTPGANATVHWIAGFRIVNGAIDPNFSPIWHAASGDGTHNVNAPAAGDYVFAVIAGRTADGSTEWSRWITQRYTRQ